MEQSAAHDLNHTAHADISAHFFQWKQAVIARLLANLYAELRETPTLDEVLQNFAFLDQYLAALEVPVGETLFTWADHLLMRAQSQIEEETLYLPLRALDRFLQPTFGEISVLIAAGLIDEELRFGSLFAALQMPLESRSPCIGLLNWLLAFDGLDVWRAARRLAAEGFLVLKQAGDARTEWVLQVPTLVWDAIRGHRHAKPSADIVFQAADQFPSITDLIVSDKLFNQISRIPHVLATTQISALVVRGSNRSGRRTVVGAIAGEMGLDLLVCESWNDETKTMLGPLATLTGALPLLRCDVAPGEKLVLPLLPGFAGPVGITIGRSGGLDGPLMRHTLHLNLTAPNYELRRQFWDRTGVPIADEAYHSVLKQFHVTGGIINRASRVGLAHALLNGRDALEVKDVRQALQTLNLQALETLSTPLEPVSGWDILIVNERVREELDMLAARCRERETLQGLAGRAFENSLNRGVRALLSGPTGTGKTLAARVLASVLEMDLFRIDLAAVVNKYIGETERNLNEVFSRAEELDVVLLLDEGDSLMGQRTDVSNANDRYANLETNYLLQRIEHYEGIVLITTNAASRIDHAFMRRLDAVIEFALPEADERRALWHLHLPEEHAIDASLFEEVVQRCRMSGGQIRNVALHALLLAIRYGNTMADSHFITALRYEYRRSGEVYPLGHSTSNVQQLDRLRRYTQQLDH